MSQFEPAKKLVPDAEAKDWEPLWHRKLTQNSGTATAIHPRHWKYSCSCKSVQKEITSQTPPAYQCEEKHEGCVEQHSCTIDVRELDWSFFREDDLREVFEQEHREYLAQREYWEKWGDERKEQINREYDYYEIENYQRIKKKRLERYELDDDVRYGMKIWRHRDCTARACTMGYTYWCPAFGRRHRPLEEGELEEPERKPFYESLMFWKQCIEIEVEWS